jgi:hypothetical protein
MGKYLKGILGPFSGLVGTVVGSSWKGITYMRSRPKKSSKAPTVAQLKQRDTFALMTEFLRPLTPVINVGFLAYNNGETPFNAAFKTNIETAITGIYPALTINYPQIKLGKGRLLATPQITMATTVDAQLDFSWLNNADPTSTNGTDKVTFVVYNPAKQKYVYVQGVAARSALSYDMVLPSDFSSDNVHIWAFMAKADLKQSSDSVYLGATVVQ